MLGSLTGHIIHAHEIATQDVDGARKEFFRRVKVGSMLKSMRRIGAMERRVLTDIVLATTDDPAEIEPITNGLIHRLTAPGRPLMNGGRDIPAGLGDDFLEELLIQFDFQPESFERSPEPNETTVRRGLESTLEHLYHHLDGEFSHFTGNDQPEDEPFNPDYTFMDTNFSLETLSYFGHSDMEGVSNTWQITNLILHAHQKSPTNQSSMTSEGFRRTKVGLIFDWSHLASMEKAILEDLVISSTDTFEEAEKLAHTLREYLAETIHLKERQIPTTSFGDDFLDAILAINFQPGKVTGSVTDKL